MLAWPKMEYASAVWDPYQKDQIDELEKLQRRAARITTNRCRNTSSVGEMLQDLGWKSLELRRRDSRLTLMFKILQGDVCIQCPGLNVAVQRSRRTSVAHSRQLVRHVCKKDYRLNAFLPRTVRQWNALPEHVVSAACADTFRQKVSDLV